ncbi:MAG: putative proline-rich protein [Burkholderiaceae bacterium]|jgi:hypothetical protein|nr:MAG: putative proline-rich protein [Burkholderiaceae bacterium]
MRYRKTELGLRALRERSADLALRQRSAFILFDGTRTVSDVLAATSGLGVVEADVAHMVALGLLGPADESPSVAGTAPVSASRNAQAAPALPAAPAAPPASESSPKERYLKAYPIATQLTASMGLRGFRLNLAVEAALGYEQLVQLVPRIRDAVGAEKCRPLERALEGVGN